MELLDIIIIGTVIASIGAWIGWKARGIVMMAMLSQNPEHVIAILEKIKQINDEDDLGNKLVKAVAVEVEPELVNGQWYAYIKGSKQFVGQGSTIEAALANARTRFPDKSFWCNKPNESSQTA
jgi:hypothetical protein